MSEKALWSLGPFTLRRRGLEVDEHASAATSAQIKNAASSVLTYRDSGAWAIGDLAVYAEGIGKSDPIDSVTEDLVRDRNWVRKCYYVAKTFTMAERVFDLWWTFYYMTYSIPDPELRARLLKMAETKKWTLEEFRSHMKSLRHSVRKELQKFPKGQYGLIYADPPWKYDNSGDGVNGAALKHYATMDVDEIKGLADPQGRSVTDVAAKDCILYLWATTALLPDALAVMEAWGFEYKSSMVWVKDIQGLGFWARSRHEFLLIGTRGDVIPPVEEVRPDSVIQEPRGEHSAKPDIVYDMLETMFSQPKIELFAREARDGWDRWGAEAPGEPEKVTDMPPSVMTNAEDVDAQTGDVQEAGAIAEMREAVTGKKRKAEPKSRVSESASSKDKPKPRLVKGAKKKAS